jgi:chemotaxis protein MotD
MGAVGASPVKELDVQLNPADLGSLTVKMRLSNGNLAVVIEAAKSSTARLIESERDAIVERLTSVDQPVASVVVQASDSVPTQGENSNASGSATSQQSDAQSNAANGSNGHARSSRDGEGGAQTRQNGSADDEAARRARTGDLFV